jgi:hypothetical protein
MWIGLNRAGIGIHGTNSPQTIGRSSSHGCMRTANWDVIRLVKMITQGMPVTIEGPAPSPRPVIAKKKETTPPPPPPEPPKKSFFQRLFGKK